MLFYAILLDDIFIILLKYRIGYNSIVQFISTTYKTIYKQATFISPFSIPPISTYFQNCTYAITSHTIIPHKNYQPNSNIPQSRRHIAPINRINNAQVPQPQHNHINQTTITHKFRQRNERKENQNPLPIDCERTRPSS